MLHPAPRMVKDYLYGAGAGRLRRPLRNIRAQQGQAGLMQFTGGRGGLHEKKLEKCFDRKPPT